MSAQGLSREAIEAANAAALAEADRVTRQERGEPYASAVGTGRITSAAMSAAYPIIRRDVARDAAAWMREQAEREPERNWLWDFAADRIEQFASVREGVES